MSLQVPPNDSDAFKSLIREEQTPNVDELKRVIEQSRSLLDHPVDDETPVSLSTWKRVKTFLLNQASVSHKLFGVPLPVPDINPADEGSIDLFWRFEGHQLLLNFPADAGEPITYYGQALGGAHTIAGRTTSQDERPDLVAWLIQKKK